MHRRTDTLSVPLLCRVSSNARRAGRAIFFSAVFLSCWTEVALAQSVEPSWCRVCEPTTDWRAGFAEVQPLGTRKVLYYLLRFPGDTNDLLTAAEVDWAMQTANAVFQRASYGQFQVQWTITPSLTLPHSRDWYGPTGHELLATDARALALSAGLNWEEFDYDIFQHRKLPGTFYSGLGNLPGRGVWLVYEGSVLTYPHLVVHELGHNFGLPHANSHYTGNPLFGHPGGTPFGFFSTPPFPSNVGAFTNIMRFDPASMTGQPDVRTATISLEYGDPFDVMGNNNLHGGYNAAYRRRLNWLAESNVANAVTSGVYRIYAVDAGSLSAGRSYALRVERPLLGRGTDGSARRYWVQHLGAFATNADFNVGIQLRWEPDSASQSQYVDSDPAKADYRTETRFLRPGRTFSDPLADLHVTPIAAGGTGNDRWYDVAVGLGASASNRAPVLSLSASRANAPPGVQVRFTAMASDADGDALHFFWDFGDGAYASGTNRVDHAFADTVSGSVVRCEVTDTRGGVASAHVFVGVGNQPAGRITGHVRDTEGNPIAGASVHNGRFDIWSGIQPDFLTTKTDSLGQFTLLCTNANTNIPGAFVYGYRVMSPPPGLEVVVQPGSTTNLDFVLERLVEVKISVAPQQATEGTSNVVFTFTRSGPTQQPLEVWIQTSGKATWPDYASGITNSRIVIPAGTNAVSIAVNVLRDVEVEGNESLAVAAVAPRQELREIVSGGATNLVFFYHPGWELRSYRGQPAWFVTEPRYALSADSSATLTILDTTPPDLPQISVFAGDVQAAEHPPTAGHFRLIRQGNTNVALAIHLSLGGQAINGADYAMVPGIVQMPAGATNLLVSILPFDDGIPEGDEFLTLVLSLSPELNYGIRTPWADLSILDSPIVAHRLAFGERFGGDKVLEVYGELGRTFIVDTSTNLPIWRPFATNTIQFNPTYVDIPFWQDGARFYKSRLLPP